MEAAGLDKRPYARIAVARPMRGCLTYSIPPEHMDTLAPGHVVLVPLGKRGGETGYVVERIESPDFDPSKVKRITRLLDPVPAFDSQQLAFFTWIAEYYFFPLGLVIQTALPSQIRAKVVSILEPTELGVDTLASGFDDAHALMVLREIVARPGLTRRGILRKLDGELDKDEVTRAIETLIKRAFAVWSEREVRESKGQ